MFAERVFLDFPRFSGIRPPCTDLYKSYKMLLYRLTERFESEPTIGVLYSATDTRRDWVLAGQALQRALLTATARGVSTTLMTQPMEIPSRRSLLTDPTLRLVPQVIVRFGYGPPTPATPRRPVADLIDPERPCPGGPSASARRTARAVA